MPNLNVLVGLPASGKSYYAKTLLISQNAKVHSTDAIREEFFGDINNQQNNDKVFSTLYQRVKNDLISGYNVVVDSTNISMNKRLTLLNQFRNINCEKVCYLFATPYDRCLTQNQQRDRTISPDVIKYMYTNFHIPQLYEGWDKIVIIWNYDKHDFNLNELFNGANGLNFLSHDNPFHVHTIGKHCAKCFTLIQEMTDDQLLIEAAIYHDIGKQFTKSFSNTKGVKTEEAHYYNHQSVSAYLSMFYTRNNGYNSKQILDICKYIQWHMQPFFMRNKVSEIETFIKIVGKEFYDKLMILNKADVIAHQ